MAKTTDTKAEVVKDPRQERWEAFLALAAKQNALFEQQKANGEFDKIPDSFV
jgi:hypothetical protein